MTLPYALDDIAPAVEAASVPLLCVDEAGRILLMNPSCEDLLGYSRESLSRRPLTSLIANEEQAEQLRECLTHSECEAMRVDFLRDNRIQTLDIAAQKVSPEKTGAPRWLIKLSQAPSEGSAWAQDLESCLRSVVHDLRGPMGSLRAFSELLERDFGSRLGELGQRYVERLRSNTDRVQSLLEDLLDRFQMRSVENDRTFISPREVLDELVGELKPQLEKAGIGLMLPADPPAVYANPVRFRQVLLNLVLNAVQHMGEVPDPEIRIAIEKNDQGATLEISDNGVGLPAEEHAQIYELFACAQGARDWRSTGLGLSIVKRIVSAHGGNVEVDSQPGHGATFRAFFPH